MKVFSAIFALTMMATYCHGATISDVENDISNINGNITAFNTALSSFNASPGIISVLVSSLIFIEALTLSEMCLLCDTKKTLASNAQSTIIAINQGVTDAQVCTLLRWRDKASKRSIFV